MTIHYRDASVSDIELLADLHINFLNDGVLYLIGENSLSKIYESILNAKNNIIVATTAKNIIGFVTVIHKEFGTIGKISMQGWLSVFSCLLKNPRLIECLISTYLFDRESKKLISRYTKGADFSELSHFVVDNIHQRKGIGKALLIDAEVCARHRHSVYMYTTTHNYDLLQYYVSSRNAKVINRRRIGNLYHYCLLWKI